MLDLKKIYNIWRIKMSFQELTTHEEALKNYLTIKNNHNNEILPSLLKIFQTEKNKICSSYLGDCKINNHQIRYYLGEEETQNHTNDIFLIKEILIKYLPKIENERIEIKDNHLFSVANGKYFITGFDLKNMMSTNHPIILSYNETSEPYFKAISAKVLLSGNIIEKIYFNKTEWLNDLKYLIHESVLTLDDLNSLPDDNWIIPTTQYTFIPIEKALDIYKQETLNNVIFICSNKTYGISYKDFCSKLHDKKDVLYKSKANGRYCFIDGTIEVITTKTTGVPHLEKRTYSKNEYSKYKEDLLNLTIDLIPMSEFNFSSQN